MPTFWPNSTFTTTVWPNLSNTPPAPHAGLGTTAQNMMTVGGSVSDAGTLVGATNLPSWLSDQVVPTMNGQNQNSISPATAQASTQTTSPNSLSEPALAEVLQEIQDLFSHPAGINSSMATKTRKAPLNAYKPVTLTLTGKLKPSILTKETPQKSSQSTKKSQEASTWITTTGPGWGETHDPHAWL